MAVNELAANLTGTGTVTGTLGIAIGAGLLAGFEIPYSFLGTGRAVDDVVGIVKGRSTVISTLSIVVVPTVSSDGVATVTGTLFTAAGPAWMAATSVGTSTVTGWLLNRVNANVVELIGTSDGVATVDNYAWLTINMTPDPVAQARYLYLLANVGVSFDPTDDDSGDSRWVSQTYTDGAVIVFDRYLYLLGNIGVSFDPTDDDSTDPRFVSQTFVDGDTVEFSRYLYLLSVVMDAEPVAYGNLTVGPGYRGQEHALPDRTPPSQRL